MRDTVDFTSAGEIAKLSNDQQVVWGWMSVTVDKGQPVVDLQGDVIRTEVLQKAVWKFVGTQRTAAAMHARDAKGDPVKIGEIVDSLVVTKDLARVLGLPDGREGWIVGIKIDDPEVWAKVKSGEYAMFSLAGRGKRVRVGA